jgi:3',5'-cyclic AMP phosphodiesterase CpdA
MTNSHPFDNRPSPLSRRAFLQSGTLLLAGSTLDWSRCALPAAEPDAARPALRVGLLTDLHYADKDPAGSRHYRETLDKLARAVGQFEQDRPDFTVELGDFIDAADSVADEKRYLKRIQKEFSAIPGGRHYVLGNHCVDTLTKPEFLDGIGREKSYYSFDAGGVHFVVLDSCFLGDGTPYGRKNFHWTDPNVPAEELEWLRADLAKAKGGTVVFAHQRLAPGHPYGVKNAPEIRRLFEESGKVLAVFQGHSHRNDYTEISGIHYCTLVAMVEGPGPENNAWARLDVEKDGTMRVVGFLKQKDYEWS